MDVEENRLTDTDQVLMESVRYITITPQGELLSGWSKADAVLILMNLAEKWNEQRLEELGMAE